MDRVISCGAAVEQLWAFLDHELDDREQRAVAPHLAFSRRCCGEMEFANHLRRLLATKGTDELPGEVRTRLDQFIDELAETTPEGGAP
jgi:anti-sigma factor (TIGR02949 family)